MDSIISYKSRRLLTILEIVVMNDGYASVDTIVNRNKCSNKTAYSDLNFLKDSYSDIMDLKIINKEITISNLAVPGIIEIKKDILKHEFIITFILSVYFYPASTLEQHAIRINYSASYIRKNFQDVNKFLLKYNCEIKYIQEEFGYVLLPIGNDDKTIIFLIAYFAGILEIDHDILNLDEADASRLEIVFREFSDNIPSLIKLNIEWIYRIVKTDVYLYNKVWNFQRVEDLSSVDFDASVKLIMDRLNGVIVQFKDNDEEIAKAMIVDVLKYITVKTMYLPCKLDTHLNRYDIFYHDLRKENPAFISYCDGLISELSHLYNIDYSIYRTEILFLIYTYSYKYVKLQKLKIGVYSHLGYEHSLYMKQKIQDSFYLHEIEIFDAKEHYDLCISNSYNLLDDDYTSVIYVSDYINYKDLMLISMYLK